MKKEKRNYEAPSLTVVSFKAERGFVGSGDSSLTSEHDNLNKASEVNYNREDYTNGRSDTWGTFNI